MAFVVRAYSGVGVQLNTPLVRCIRALRGAPGARLKKNSWLGTSGSMAELVTTSAVWTSVDCVDTGVRTGGRFTSCTRRRSVRLAFRDGTPLSRTVTVIRYSPGPR